MPAQPTPKSRSATSPLQRRRLTVLQAGPRPPTFAAASTTAKSTSFPDGYSPPKAVERARRPVESEEVFLIFGSLGTPSNTATQKYMNAKKVPQLFVQTGATKWNDPQNFPCTIGWSPNYQNEARI